MRVVFTADTHLGLDQPIRETHVERPRRADDFLANFDTVLRHARESRAHLLLHGGDLFFRSKVRNCVVDPVYERFIALADDGVHIGLIAGNHDRAALPSPMLLAHPNIHIFYGASTHVFEVDGMRVAVTGVPFVYGDCRTGLPRALSDAANTRADVRLALCHQAFEGATVGPADFTFSVGEDVVPLSGLPGFDAFLVGHIHRAQVLWTPERTPVIYPGSIERTSFAERDEEKRFVTLEWRNSSTRCLRYHGLPSRPMHTVDLSAATAAHAHRQLQDQLAALPGNSIVRVITGTHHVPSALVRQLGGPDMIVSARER